MAKKIEPFISIDIYGIPAFGGSDREVAMEFMTWMKENGSLPRTYMYPDGKEPYKTYDLDFIFSQQHHEYCPESDFPRRVTDCDSSVGFAIDIPWEFPGGLDISASVEFWEEKKYWSFHVNTFYGNQELTLESFNHVSEWARDLAFKIHKKYGAMISLVDASSVDLRVFRATNPRMYGGWYSIYDKSMQEKFKLEKRLAYIPDNMTAEKFGDDLVIKSNALFSEYLQNGWTLTDRIFWKMAKAKILYAPGKDLEPTEEDDGMLFRIVGGDEEGNVVLEPLDKEKIVAEKNKTGEVS